MMKTRASAILFLSFALVGFCGSKAIAWGPITHMTILDDVLIDSRLNPDVKKILQENLKYAKGGATGPDMYYFFDKRYSDMAHYCSPGDFVRKMLEMAKKDGDPKKIAFAYGWMIHVASDPIGHGWVNSLAGGAYDPKNSEIKSAHSNIEWSIDKKNLMDHGQPIIEPESEVILYHSYDTNIDSPDIFNFRVFSSFFECRDNAPTADVGQIAANTAQLVYKGYQFLIRGMDENQYNTVEYQYAYRESVSEAIRAINASGGTLENWDLDTGEPEYKVIDGERQRNPNYEGYEKCKENGKLKNCGPVSRSSAGNDHSDDTVSAGDGNGTSETLSLDSLYRLAPKKGKRWMLWLKAVEDANAEYNGLPPDASPELRQEKLDRISGLVSQLNDPSNWREFSANNSQLFNEIEEIPDVAVLENGYFEEMTNLITKSHEPVRTVSIDFSPMIVESQPVLVIPSGGLYGLEKSEVFKASLDEYVKQGGTLIVLGQQHGYEFSVLPVPQEEDGTYKRVGGYGWSEDQSCFYASSYIDTWLQFLSGQSKATPTINVDGYFTVFPSNTTVITRRTLNGQPDLLMYEYGHGRVIVSSMYTDYALKENHASSEEIALIRDMISWAKKPEQLPEIKPGQSVTLSVSVTNRAANEATSLKFLIYHPDRTTLLSEQALSLSLPAGQSVVIPVAYSITQSSALGIYHVDYILYDSSGKMIQPQAEIDSGRFAVSNPPANPYKPKDLLYSVNVSRGHFVPGEPIPITVTVWNNSDADKKVRYYWDYTHSIAVFLEEVQVPPQGSVSRSYTLPPINDQVMLWVHFFEENGTAVRQTPSNIRGESWPYVGNRGMTIPVIQPSASATVKTDKALYAKGETVAISVTLQNQIILSWQPNVQIAIYDSRHNKIFGETKIVTLPPSGTGSVSTSFTLPSNSTIGSYSVGVEMRSGNLGYVSSAWTSFNLPQSQLSVSPNLLSAFTAGANTLPVAITNTGKIDVNSGTIDLILKAPDGTIVYSGSQAFNVAAGESKTMDVPISIPPLEWGDYVLTYSQSDETKAGNSATLIIPNSALLVLSLDKPSYAVRETANLTVNLKNTGKFGLENLSVTVSAPDASYTDTRTISLGLNPASGLLNFAIPIPDTITAGQNNVIVTAALSSGATFVNYTTLTVPYSELVIGYSGSTTLATGDSLNLTIENTGGVDTTYTTEKLLIKNSQGKRIYEGGVSGTILSGEKKILTNIQIPSQTLNGPAFLDVEVKDNRTGKLAQYSKVLGIIGLASDLSVRTDKEVYLKTESITGISSIINGRFGIENGSLKIDVTTIMGDTGQFSLFLPKQGWWPFNRPQGVALGSDGSIYIADTFNDRIVKFDRNIKFVTSWGSHCQTDTNYDYVPDQPCDGKFFQPSGISVGPDGSVYVADTGNHRIQKFDSNGNFIAKWGRYGSGNGQFAAPEGVVVGPEGTVYVADTGNSRIQKFASNGNFILKWGTSGVGDGQFYSPEGIAARSNGTVYVTDTGNHRIQKFDSNGSFVMKWGTGCLTDPNWDGVPDQECDGQFYYPGGIAVGADSSVYVTDSGNRRIQEFDGNENFTRKWGSFGGGDGQFGEPFGIAVGSDNSVYVVDVDPDNNRIQKFDQVGNFITKWGSWNQGDGNFIGPMGVTTDFDGFVYVAEYGNNRIQKFDRSGNFITKWGSYCQTDTNWDYVPDEPCDGQFSSPQAIAAGSNGSVYVADTGNHRIQRFDSSGNFIAKWGSLGSGDGQFRSPIDIAVTSDGFVYVVEYGNDRIQKFDISGNFIAKWGSRGSGDGQFYSPSGIAVGPDGLICVVDTYNNRIQKFDSRGNFIMKWGSSCRTDSNWDGVPDQECDGQFYSPGGIGIGADNSVYVADSGNRRIQMFDSSGNFIRKWGSYGVGDGEFFALQKIATGPDGSVYAADAANHRIQKMVPEGSAQTLFETTIPINQSANMAQDYTTNIGKLHAEGKLYLQADLRNSFGQTIAQANYPFYVFAGDTVLRFNTDKRVYKPGEAVSVTGQIENHSAIEAVNLAFSLTSRISAQNPQLILANSFSVPAGGAYPFTITTTAGAEGTVTLTGVVTQNNSTLAEISDQYEVAKTNVSVSVSGPDIVGNEPFDITVEVKNTGKVNSGVQLSVVSDQGSTIDQQQLVIPPGESKIIQYSQQISKDVTYTFTFAGDMEQAATKTVSYGFGTTVQLGAGSSVLGIFPEGSVVVPVTVTNTGPLAENLAISFTLNPGDLTQTKAYYLQPGTSAADTLLFNLVEGSYQITASSQQPDAFAQASFSIRKENQAQIGISLNTQADGLVPINVNLTNNGFNTIEGIVQLSIVDSAGATVWYGSQEVALTSSPIPAPSTQIFNINPSVLPAGDYTLKAELLNNTGQEISVQSSSFGVQSASFQIIQLPSYQTFPAGQEATFTFLVKNIGNQEGSFDLGFKAYDLIDSTQRQWLKPNEEKNISFGFMLPDNLEEKDYFADYELKASAVAGQSKGQIKYHLAGISLNVNASLDKACYTEGETAHLTINIQSPNPAPQSLFARLNYAGYEPQQTFTLNGNQVLIFDIPLPKITGEKLFYGIYNEGGRSIHLNAVYIHKSGDVITITTDKQVYNPGEAVSVSLSGNTSGNMTISAPGGYTETFIFTGSATKSFNLPVAVTAGTYFINVQLSAPNSEPITAVHPFDVAGIQVKVLESNNDRGKYAASDNIATGFTITSNTTMAAILKAWIVDPTGQYTSVGEQNITLSPSEGSLITYNSALSTSVSGIHRLVYGIYGPEDLLLCSGSEAFDVGDAVLLGISTDKRDYPTNTEPVTVTARLYGSIRSDLQFEVDGSQVRNEPVSLNGLTTYTTQLQNITPGPHTLRGTLTVGGLKSTRETNFTYALGYIPKPQIIASPAFLDFGSLNLGTTSSQRTTLSSTGNVDLVVGTITLFGANQGEFSVQNDNCSGRTIPPSGNCTLDVIFSPNSPGLKSSSLSISSNAIDTPTLDVSLGGTGATTLNLSINPGGSGRVTGTGIDCPGDCRESFLTSGATIQLTATPSEGYAFTNWTIDINLAENPVTVNMDANKNVAANFAINTYTVTATAGLGGIISPSGSVAMNYGGSQTFTITPSLGYYLMSIVVDGTPIGAVSAYTFSNVTSDHIIEASFAISQYTITTNAGPNGAIIPSGTLIVNHGESKIFTITPDTGYRVAGVKVDGVSVGAVTTFPFEDVTFNHTIEATFEFVNQSPVADAGLDQYVITGQVATLNGSKSFDPEGVMITFLWAFVEVPTESSVTNLSLSDVTSAKPQFTPDVNGIYRLQLIVNDGASDSVADEVVINASIPNVPPNANAGPDQNVFTGNTVQLNGSRSSDPDNGPLSLSYLWSFVTKPAGSLLTDNHILNSRMPNSVFIPDVDGLYELRLTVNDGDLSSEDTVQIMATLPNVPPNANAGVDMTIYLGNTAVLNGSASDDPDHGPQPLSYLWSFVAVPTGSQLTNGAISGAGTVSALFIPDVAGTYVLQLVVHDGIDAGFDNVAVTVGTKRLAALAPVKVWLGLKNSDDQGTNFDLRVDLLKNGVMIATGETRDIRGITRNPNLAKQAAVTFGSTSNNQLNSGDTLSLRILTKVTASGGHSNAVGLRLYYDAVSRPSRVGMEISPDPMRDYFLHSDSSGDLLNNTSPTTIDAKYTDSPSVGRTTYREIGTWNLTVP